MLRLIEEKKPLPLWECQEITFESILWPSSGNIHIANMNFIFPNLPSDTIQIECDHIDAQTGEPTYYKICLKINGIYEFAKTNNW